MARVLTNSSLCKTLTLVSDGISFFAPSHRRGYAAAAEAVRRTAKPEDKAAVAQLLAAKRVATADPDPWVPDPVTGYYRPANGPVQVDAAELRAMLLRPKA